MLALLLGISIAAAPNARHHARKIAVLDVEDVTGNEATKARLLTQVIVGDLPKLGDFEVIGPNDIRSLIGFERQKQLLGCKEDACLAELGGALGVDDIVTGQLGKLGTRYRFDVRLLDARRSRVVASEGDFVAANDDTLAESVEHMVRKLLADGGLTTPTAEPAAGGLDQAAPQAGSSHVGAWVTAGGAAVLGVAAVIMTLQARSTFQDDQACYQGTKPGPCSAYNPDTTDHIADALWVGTAALAGVSTYLFLSAPSSAGAGGEVGLRGTF